MQLKEDAEFEGNKIFMDYTDERSSFPPREPKKPKSTYHRDLIINISWASLPITDSC